MIIHNIFPKDLAQSEVPAKLFQGVDTVLGELRNTIVDGTYSTSQSAASQELTVSVDYESFSKSTQIDQSASVGVGLFSGTEKVQFTKTVERSSWAVNMVIRSTHITGATESRNARIDAGGFDMRDPDARLEFFNRYGDSYYSSVTFGSEYLAIFTFHLSSESERSSTMTSLGLSGLLSAVTFNADLQTKISSFFAKTSAQVTLRQSAFGLGDKPLPAFEDMIEFARKLPSLPVVSPAVIRSAVSGYETLLPARSFDAIAANRSYFVGTNFSRGVYRDRTVISNMIGQLDTIHAVQEIYGHDEPALRTAKLAAETDLAKLNEQVETYKKEPEHVFYKPDLPSLAKGSPNLAYESGSSPAWGGTGGGSFDDIAEVGGVGDFINLRRHIRSLRLYSGEYVRCLVVKYKGNSGGPEVEKIHGEQGGTRGHELYVENGDRIGKLTGCSGSYVDQLEIALAPSGKSVGAGVMRGELGKINWSAGTGQIVIGFRGYSGSNLDQIQAVWVRFLPTVWKAPF